MPRSAGDTKRLQPPEHAGPPKKLASHIATGRAGEEEALRFLTARRFSLLARNWRPHGAARGLELDLVGRSGDTVVFVEVKTRRLDGPHEQPPVIAQFSPAKKRNMLRAAQAFLGEYNLWGKSVRCDLVCVTFRGDTKPLVEQYCDVIELGQTLGGGDTTWQPW